MEKSQLEQTAVELTKTLLDKLNLKYSDVVSVYNDEDPEQKSVNINITGDDLGILIGYHGKNLDSLKTYLSLVINKNLERDNSVRIFVNVNDYAEKRVEQLKHMLEGAKSAIESGKEFYSLPPMNPADRRIIHSLADEMGLKTSSEGEGRERHVIVKLA